MAGVKGKSGRKKKTITTANAHRRIQQLLPAAIETIGETVAGVNMDRLRYEAAVEIKDSALGKPKAQTDINVEGGEKLMVGTVVAMFQEMERARRAELQAKFEPKQLEEGKDA